MGDAQVRDLHPTYHSSLSGCLFNHRLGPHLSGLNTVSASVLGTRQPAAIRGLNFQQPNSAPTGRKHEVIRIEHRSGRACLYTSDDLRAPQFD